MGAMPRGRGTRALAGSATLLLSFYSLAGARGARPWLPLLRSVRPMWRSALPYVSSAALVRGSCMSYSCVVELLSFASKKWPVALLRGASLSLPVLRGVLFAVPCFAMRATELLVSFDASRLRSIVVNFQHLAHGTYGLLCALHGSWFVASATSAVVVLLLAVLLLQLSVARSLVSAPANVPLGCVVTGVLCAPCGCLHVASSALAAACRLSLHALVARTALMLLLSIRRPRLAFAMRSRTLSASGSRPSLTISGCLLSPTSSVLFDGQCAPLSRGLRIASCICHATVPWCMLALRILP